MLVRTYIRTRTHAHMLTCTHTNTNTHTHIYTHSHIHTHIHTITHTPQILTHNRTCDLLSAIIIIMHTAMHKRSQPKKRVLENTDQILQQQLYGNHLRKTRPICCMSIENDNFINSFSCILIKSI